MRKRQTQPQNSSKDNSSDLIQQLKESEERNKELQKRNNALFVQNANLKAGFGTKFLTGNRKLVTCLYSQGIVAYLHIQYVAMQRAKQDNDKGCYPFLYKTNAKLLANQFGISYEASAKIIKFLNATGAWRLIKTETEPAKMYTYKLGERKRISCSINGKRALGYVNKFYFTLSKNSKSLNFYKKEIERLTRIQNKRKQKAKKIQEEKVEIKRIKDEIDKKLIELHGETKAPRAKKAIHSIFQEGKSGEYSGEDVLNWASILEDIKSTIAKEKRKKFNPYTGTRRTLNDRLQQIEKNKKGKEV